jgi:dsDNA-specific endonuclease/ATPase MutS2
VFSLLKEHSRIPFVYAVVIDDKPRYGVSEILSEFNAKMGNFSAMLWREQVIFDEMIMMFVLY